MRKKKRVGAPLGSSSLDRRKGGASWQEAPVGGELESGQAYLENSQMVDFSDLESSPYGMGQPPQIVKELEKQRRVLKKRGDDANVFWKQN